MGAEHPPYESSYGFWLLEAADCALVMLRNEMLGVMSPSKLHARLAFGLPIVYVGPRGSNVDRAIEQFACRVSRAALIVMENDVVRGQRGGPEHVRDGALNNPFLVGG